MSSETAIAEPAAIEPASSSPVVADRPRLKVEDLVQRWHSLGTRAGALLRDPAAPQFVPAARRLDEEIAVLAQDEPESSTLLLLQTACNDTHRYSVNHALLVALVCDLAARLLPDCTDAQRTSLRLGALTMNIAMTRVQDQLALQDGPVTADQRTLIEGHAQRGREMLGELGVDDPLWLDIVEHHHSAPPGALGEQPIGQRLARVVQRTDVFAARMSPRKLRPALSANLAAKGAYFDERKQPDEAGSLVIKAVGVYPAGSSVQLASGELAVVLKRGAAVNKPIVAAVADAHGYPHVQPQLRSTDTQRTAIVRGVPPKDVRVRVAVERLLKLAR